MVVKHQRFGHRPEGAGRQDRQRRHDERGRREQGAEHGARDGHGARGPIVTRLPGKSAGDGEDDDERSGPARKHDDCGCDVVEIGLNV